MTCQHVMDMIDAGPFVAHSRDQVAAAHAHIRQCERCAAAFQFSVSLSLRLEALTSPEPSHDLTQKVMARIATLTARATQPASAPQAAAVQAQSKIARAQPARVPAPQAPRWMPAVGALAAAAATVLITASVATSSDSLMPSVAAFRMGLFAMPALGDELLAGAMGTMLYAFGLFASGRLSQKQSALPRRPGDAEHLSGPS